MNSPYNPFSFQQYGYQPVNVGSPGTQQLIKVSGLEGAKAYQMPANSAVALFHESEDLMYIKTTDGAGFPTIKAFRFEAVPETVETSTRYVTMDEFEKFKEEILNGKQSVQ